MDRQDSSPASYSDILPIGTSGLFIVANIHLHILNVKYINVVLL